MPKVIAKLGDFNGIDSKGIAQGFLFPIDSDWTLQVKVYTVSAISASIPPTSSGSDDNNAQ